MCNSLGKGNVTKRTVDHGLIATLRITYFFALVKTSATVTIISFILREVFREHQARIAKISNVRHDVHVQVRCSLIKTQSTIAFDTFTIESDESEETKDNKRNWNKFKLHADCHE